MNIHHFKQTDLPLTLTPDRTAIILVDMQNAFLSDRGSDARAGFDTSRAKQVVAPVRRLLEHFRTGRSTRRFYADEPPRRLPRCRVAE